MPHSFAIRPHNDESLLKNPDLLEAQIRWDTFKAFSYKLGGVIFIIGSILFLPAYSQYSDFGVWSFILGSFVYLVVTGHDMLEVLSKRKIMKEKFSFWDKLEYGSAWSYLVGTLLFTIGSFLFLSTIGQFRSGAWCFVIGSLLFVLGAIINVLQVVRAKDIITLQLFNLTAVSFVTGSVLFVVASIPYLFQFESPTDEKMVSQFLAWQYIFGSVLFLLGGFFIYLRSLVETKRLRYQAKLYMQEHLHEE